MTSTGKSEELVVGEQECQDKKAVVVEKGKKKTSPSPSPETLGKDGESKNVEPEKKSKKQLNKERKKLEKAARKTDDAPGPSTDKTEPSVSNSKSIPMLSESVVPPNGENPEIRYGSNCIPLVSFVVGSLLGKTEWFKGSSNMNSRMPILVFNDGKTISGDFAIARYLGRISTETGLYGYDAVSSSVVDSWMEFALRYLNKEHLSSSLEFLNTYLENKTYFIGFSMTLADIAVWSVAKDFLEEFKLQPHAFRWLQHFESMELFGTAWNVLVSKIVVSKQPHQPKKTDVVSQKGKTSGSCPELEGAIDGQVVTRFPPEPSGYLHIGHVKACMLNDYYARHYNGKLIVRFDDTNPSKEKMEFEESIIGDLAKLNIKGDILSYTSDHFPLIQQHAIKLIQEGKAYMDNTVQEQMRQERMDGINSVKRDTKVEENLVLFQALLEGKPEAEGYCLRAKIDMQAKNKTLRDPVLYRSNLTPHHRTGTKYKAYPTYDLACPIVDSHEGVTHALRTTEYNDRDFQYYWFLEALNLRPVKICSFARLNFVYSVLSKRKLQYFVDNGHVEGWNDPRFPTIQGVLRRGVMVESLREFILSQGASRRITDMEWDKFWTMNKKVIDPIAPRYFAIFKESMVPLKLNNISHDVVGLSVPLHPKNASLGNKVTRFSQDIIVEGDDAEQMTQGEEITLMRYGNVIIQKITKDSTGKVTQLEGIANPNGDFKTTKKKITWLADVKTLPEVRLVEFDYLITKPKIEEGDKFEDFINTTSKAETIALGDHGLRNLQEGDIIQLERRGYFRCDQPYISPQKPLVLFMIPDGKVKAMSSLTTKLAHR